MTKDQYRSLIIKRADFLHRFRQVNDLGSNSIFAPSNMQYVKFEKMSPFAGVYYLKVVNKYTNKDVTFGKLAIDRVFQKQKAIDEYNKIETANLPSIVNDPFYYIVNSHLKLANFRTSMYRELTVLFFKARAARTESEVSSFEYDNDVNHAEALFIKNEQSPIFAHAAATRYRLIIAKRAALR